MEKEIIYITSKKDLKDSLREVLNETEKKAPEMDIPERLSRREAAEFLSVSYQTMHNWKKAGIIKEHGTMKKKFFLKSELIELIKTKS
ncbi:MAG: helix-turn-helix domain-containing protein [Draconibacterium sp.]|nr:helix-turn-helix domain-containing protein [Draconibacterium sp.]